MSYCCLCNKPLKLTHAIMYQCKCKKHFCAQHSKYEHACSVDRVQEYREKLSEKMPTMTNPKVERI